MRNPLSNANLPESTLCSMPAKCPAEVIRKSAPAPNSDNPLAYSRQRSNSQLKSKRSKPETSSSMRMIVGRAEIGLSHTTTGLFPKNSRISIRRLSRSSSIRTPSAIRGSHFLASGFPQAIARPNTTRCSPNVLQRIKATLRTSPARRNCISDHRESHGPADHPHSLKPLALSGRPWMGTASLRDASGISLDQGPWLYSIIEW